MINNALMRATQQPMAPWTDIPPAMSGRQVQGTSVLPYGLYQMPDGSMQSSYGLPQPLLDAYRSMRYGLGYEQDPRAPKGFVSQEAIQSGANGLSVGAMSGALPAAGANALVRGVPTATVGSGFGNGFRRVIRDMARSLRDGGDAMHQSRIDDAIPLRTPGRGTGQSMEARRWAEDPLSQIRSYAEANFTIDQIAARVGVTPEEVAQYVRRASDRGVLSGRDLDPRTARLQSKRLNQLNKEAADTLSIIRRGDKSQKRMDRRQGLRVDDAPPERLPPPQRTQQPLEGDDIPSFTKQVESEPPAQLPPPEKPKMQSSRLSDEDSGKILDAFDSWLAGGKDLPASKSKKARAEFKDFLKQNGVEASDSAINNRLNKYRNTGKSGEDLRDWASTSRKAGTLRAQTGAVPEGSTSGQPDRWDEQNGSGSAGDDEDWEG